VVKARAWFTLFIVSLGTVAATVSCGSDEATGGTNNGGASGGGIISGGGRAGSVGRAGASSGAGAGSGSGGMPSVSGSTLGAECTSDAQCTDGMICAKASGTLFGSGGPSHGMCTMACTSTNDCDVLEAGADCVNFGTKMAPLLYCLESCIEGGTVADAANKCQGRADVACVDVGTTAPQPTCLPQCVSDADCGSGLFCDKTSVLALCTKTKPPTGDPAGTPCDASSTTQTCQGYCIGIDANSTEGICTELCSIGVPCLFAGAAPGGLCTGPLTTNPGPGDLGFCESNCACTSDCKFPGELCRKWTTAESTIADALGAEGLCYSSLDTSVELTCGAGGAGGDGAGGNAGADTGSAGASGSGI